MNSNAAKKKQQRRYEHALYPSPISLPERTVGKWSVEHGVIPKGERVQVIGIRQALLRGHPAVGATVQEDRRVHKLIEKGHGLWMSDLPEELNQIGEMIWNVEPKGEVLVGGLGLGIAAAMVAQHEGVQRTLVIEREADVIALCMPKAGARYQTVRASILPYLKQSTQPFDYYLLDTWCGTNESTWWGEVLPMRRAIGKRWWSNRPVIHCWAEDIMLGQVFRNLCGDYPEHWFYKGPFRMMSEQQALDFVTAAGSPAWEKRYGAKLDALSKKGGTRD